MPGQASPEQLRPHGRYEERVCEALTGVTELRLERWKACSVAQHDACREATMSAQLPFSSRQA